MRTEDQQADATFPFFRDERFTATRRTFRKFGCDYPVFRFHDGSLWCEGAMTGRMIRLKNMGEGRLT